MRRAASLGFVAIAQFMMTGGFVWALLEGWDAMPAAVVVAFLCACGVVLVEAAVRILRPPRDRTQGTSRSAPGGDE